MRTYSNVVPFMFRPFQNAVSKFSVRIHIMLYTIHYISVWNYDTGVIWEWLWGGELYNIYMFNAHIFSFKKVLILHYKNNLFYFRWILIMRDGWMKNECWMPGRHLPKNLHKNAWKCLDTCVCFYSCQVFYKQSPVGKYSYTCGRMWVSTLFLFLKVKEDSKK